MRISRPVILTLSVLLNFASGAFADLPRGIKKPLTPPILPRPVPRPVPQFQIPDIHFTTDPVSGATNAHFRVKLQPHHIDLLKVKANLGTLFFTMTRNPITDDDMRLIAPLPMRGLMIWGGPITAEGLAHLKGHGHIESLNFHNLPKLEGGLESLTTMQKLARVHFGQLKIGDGEVAKLAAMTQLRSVGFYQCPEITDEGIKQLSRLSGLETVFLNNNPKLTRNAVKPICSLKKLTRLELDEIKINAEDAAELSQLQTLRTLSLSKSDIDDKSLEIISKNTNLESLTIPNTHITDAGLDSIARLTKLKSLDLTAARITDRGLEKLVLPDLETLNLSSTDVTNAGVRTVTKFSKLKNLSVRNTKIGPDAVANLGELKNLEYLSAQETALTSREVEQLREKLPKLRVFTAR